MSQGLKYLELAFTCKACRLEYNERLIIRTDLPPPTVAKVNGGMLYTCSRCKHSYYLEEQDVAKIRTFQSLWKKLSVESVESSTVSDEGKPTVEEILKKVAAKRLEVYEQEVLDRKLFHSPKSTS